MKLNQDYVSRSLTHGTLRHHDLLTSLISFIRNEHINRKEYNYIFKKLFDDFSDDYPFLFTSSNKDGIDVDTEKLYEYYNKVIYSDNNNSHEFDKAYEDFSNMLDAIMNFLNNIAPDNCYFGASEGDGSDFGFWLVNDDEISNEYIDEIISNEDIDEIDDNDYEYASSLVDESSNFPPKEVTDAFEEKLGYEYSLELVVTEMFKHGDFFKALCLAYKLADDENRKILNPSLITIMKNFGIIK